MLRENTTLSATSSSKRETYECYVSVKERYQEWGIEEKEADTEEDSRNMEEQEDVQPNKEEVFSPTTIDILQIIKR